jgi:predicted aspartyl protease
MGTFFYPITVSGPSGRTIQIDALVDTGASFTSLPSQVLHEFGVTPVRRARLKLADRSSHIQELGEARAEIDGEAVATLIVFGEPGSPPSIGAYTLEGLMLGVDPINQTLVPIEGWRA